MKNLVLMRFTGILILALALSSVISSFLLGKNMLDDHISFMRKTISVVDYSLDYDGDLISQVRDMYSRALTQDTRITVIDRAGKVLADSGLENVNSMENHLKRKEVESALEKGYGYATRYSSSLKQRLLYVAALTDDGQRIIRMSVSYSDIFGYMIILFPILMVGMVVAFVISVTLAARFSSRLASDGLKSQMEQMERDKKIRQEFFSNASHELKTPITSVRGYAELLCRDFVQDESMRKDFLKRILKETDHMTGLIDDILMISRLESKDAEVTLSRVWLSRVLDEVIHSLAPQAAACEVSLFRECPDICLQASVAQMRELFTNLIGNGIKYNHPGGHVWTKVWKEETAVFIEVSDDGCGIAKEDQERVFERFFRVDKGRSRKMGGTGLGLAIVKHIAAYYGGSVSLTSEPDRGSRFVVEIPLSGINRV